MEVEGHGYMSWKVISYKFVRRTLSYSGDDAKVICL